MPSFLESIFGQKPGVPVLGKVDTGKSQQEAIAQNIAAEPEAAKLADLTREQLEKMLTATMGPDWAATKDQIGKNILSLNRGELPTGVGEAVRRGSAAHALEGGYAGSGMGRNLEARDLGLTSLDLTTKGLSSAESWLASNERMLSPATQVYTSMFITPQFKYAADVEERNTQFQRDYLENQIKAMPDPVMNAVYQAVHQVGMEFIRMYTKSGSSSSTKIEPVDYGKAQNNVGSQYNVPASQDWSNNYGAGWDTAGNWGSGGSSYPQTYGPGGGSTAPDEGFGGYDSGSYTGGFE